MSILDYTMFTDFGLLDSPEPPPAPDYTALAEAEAAGDLELAQYTTEANRPDQYTPWGSSIWTQDPEGNWTQTINLSPTQQQIFDLGQQSDILMSQLGLQGAGQLGNLFQNQFSLDPLGAMNNYQQEYGKVYQAMMDRVNTDIGQDREAMRSQLVAQGIAPGTEAYNREMQRLDRQLTDARQQAEIQATRQMGERQRQEMARRRQMIAEMLTQRQTPLNEYNAFRSGTQVGMPQLPSFYNQQTVAGPDLLNAGLLTNQYNMDLYNADVAERNAIIQGLFSLGSAGLGA